MKSFHVLSLALAATLLVAPAVRAQSRDDLALAIVNGQEITRKQLVQRLVEYRGDEAVEKMANRAILAQEAAKLKITASDAEVDEKLKEIIKRFNNEADYKAFLEHSRVKEPQLKEELKNTILIQKVALNNKPITDEELDQYDCRMLTAPDKATAEKWIKDLDGGTVNFARLCSEKATLPELRSAGGRLAPFLKIEMQDVWKAISEQKLKPGSFTHTPVELPDKGWAIIKYEALIPVSSASASEKDRLIAAMTAYRVDQWLTQARAAAKVEKKPLSSDVVALVNGEPISHKLMVERLLAYNGQEALEQLANRTMLIQAAKSSGITVSDADAEARYQDVRKALGDEQKFRTYLSTANLSEQQFKDELRYTMLMERVAMKESPISDDDLTRYDVRVMTVPSLKIGQDWVAELEKGADFAKMVTQRSLNEESRPSGGRMKPFLKVEMLDVWRAIDSQKVKPGSFTRIPVLLTDNSWVLIKVENVIPVTGAMKEEREALVRQVTHYRVEQWLSQARQRAKITYPVALDAVIKES